MRSKVDLNKIVFPVYKIRDHYALYTDEIGNTIIESAYGRWALDAYSPDLPFWNRRLLLKSLGHKVYPLTKSYPVLGALLGEPSRTTFVDSTGYTFTRVKSGKTWDLLYVKILDIVWVGTSTVVFGENIPPITFNNVLNKGLKYIAVLHKKGMYIPYDFSNIIQKNTKRKI